MKEQEAKGLLSTSVLKTSSVSILPYILFWYLLSIQNKWNYK